MEAYYHNQATMPHFSGHYKTYWKRITCSSSTRTNRYSSQEENAQTSLEKHIKNTTKNQVGEGRSNFRMSRKRKTAATTTTRKRKAKVLIPNKRTPLRSRSDFSPQYEIISNLLPTEATHSSLDLFEKPHLLVTFENAFTQKMSILFR